MPDNYLALKDEIAKPAYAGLDDAAIVAALNAATAPVPQPVPAVWVANYFALTGLRATIEDVSKDTNSPLRSACLGVIDFFWGVGNGRVFDVLDANLVAMLDSFVSASLMTADQKAALVYLNAAPGPSIVAGLGFPLGVTAADLAAARNR